MLLEYEFIKLAHNVLDIELRKKIKGMDFKDLFELSMGANRYKRLEHIIKIPITNWTWLK